MNNKDVVLKRAIIFFAVIASAVIISIIVIAIKSRDRQPATVALVYQDSKLIRTISLDDVKEPYTIRVDGEEGYNILEVEKGKIRVSEASCPDKLCVNMGFRDNSLLPITCLPNHLVIKIEKEGDHQKLDDVAY